VLLNWSCINYSLSKLISPTLTVKCEEAPSLQCWKSVNQANVQFLTRHHSLVSLWFLLRVPLVVFEAKCGKFLFYGFGFMQIWLLLALQIQGKLEKLEYCAKVIILMIMAYSL